MRIGIIGCGRVLPAHLAGMRQVLEAGICEATITALCSGHIENALMFRSPEDGITPRQPMVRQPMANEPSNPMSTPHIYVSELQSERPEVYDDYRQMLDAGVIDAAIVLTQTGQHHGMAGDCFSAGVHALVEKPLAITTRAAQQMLAGARRSGCVLAVAEMIRHIEIHRAQHWAISNGRIGEMRFALHREMGVPGRAPQLGSANAWRHQRTKVGSNTAVDLGVHRLHMIEYVAGQIDSISGMAATMESTKYAFDEHSDYAQIKDESDDFCMAQLRFAGGGFGQLLIARGMHGRPLDQPSVTAYYGGAGSIVGQTLTDSSGGDHDLIDLFRREVDPALLERWFPGGVRHEFGLQFADFVNAVASDGQRRPECDGEQGLRDLALAYAQLESSCLQRPVTPREVVERKAYAWQGPIDSALGLDRD